MKNLNSLTVKSFTAENFAKFVYNDVPNDNVDPQDSLKDVLELQAETKKQTSEINRRAKEINKILDTAGTKLGTTTDAYEKFEQSLRLSLGNKISKEFKLLPLLNFDVDNEFGIDGNEFDDYTKYLNQMLEGLGEMPQLPDNYQTPDEKRKAYEILTVYGEKPETSGVKELIKNGVEIATIEARIKIYNQISGDNFIKLSNNLRGSLLNFNRTGGMRERTLNNLIEVRKELFTEDFANTNKIIKNCEFEKWDGYQDPNYYQFGSETVGYQEFLQRVLSLSDISGAEISQAFNDSPSLETRKSRLQAKENLVDFEVKNLATLEKAERLERFLDALEKWSEIEKESFTEIREARTYLTQNGDKPDLVGAQNKIDKVLKDHSDYYETNDDFWDWGWMTDYLKLLTTQGQIQYMVEKNLKESGKFIGGFGQRNSEWIMQSDMNLSVALRAIKNTEQAGEIMRNEALKLQVISAKKEEDRTEAEKKYLAENEKYIDSHQEELKATEKIKKDADVLELGLRNTAEKRYDQLLSSLRGNGNEPLPPEYLQILEQGRENVIKGIISRLATQKATDDYIEANGTDNLKDSALLAQYNDMKGLDGFWNWSDENVEMGKEMAKMVVVIILTEIATMGLASVFVAAEAAAVGAEGVNLIRTVSGGFKVGKNVYKTIEEAEQAAAILRTTSKGIRMGQKIHEMAKGSGILNYGAKGLNYFNKGVNWFEQYKLGRFGKEVFTGAAKFTAMEQALFGLDSPDKIMTKFGENVEMFALFGIAGKGSELITSKLFPKLVEKVGVGSFLAKQGIALTSEFGVFATFQAAEIALNNGMDWEDFSWEEMAHMMTFSAVMRLAHGFPNLAKKLRSFKENSKYEKSRSVEDIRLEHTQNSARISEIESEIQSINYGLKNGTSVEGRTLNKTEKQNLKSRRRLLEAQKGLLEQRNKKLNSRISKDSKKYEDLREKEHSSENNTETEHKKSRKQIKEEWKNQNQNFENMKEGKNKEINTKKQELKDLEIKSEIKEIDEMNLFENGKWVNTPEGKFKFEVENLPNGKTVVRLYKEGSTSPFKSGEVQVNKDGALIPDNRGANDVFAKRSELVAKTKEKMKTDLKKKHKLSETEMNRYETELRNNPSETKKDLDTKIEAKKEAINDLETLVESTNNLQTEAKQSYKEELAASPKRVRKIYDKLKNLFKKGNQEAGTNSGENSKKKGGKLKGIAKLLGLTVVLSAGSTAFSKINPDTGKSTLLNNHDLLEHLNTLPAEKIQEVENIVDDTEVIPEPPVENIDIDLKEDDINASLLSDIEEENSKFLEELEVIPKMKMIDKASNGEVLEERPSSYEFNKLSVEDYKDLIKREREIFKLTKEDLKEEFKSEKINRKKMRAERKLARQTKRKNIKELRKARRKARREKEK